MLLGSAFMLKDCLPFEVTGLEMHPFIRNQSDGLKDRNGASITPTKMEGGGKFKVRCQWLTVFTCLIPL